MAYKIFTDKPTLFECTLELDGASLKDTKARLVIEAPDRTLMFTGHVTTDGVCEISIGKLRGLLDEHITGTVKLEVIAEDTYFQPWESNFVVEASKKVTVEVKEVPVPSKPALRVEVATPTQRISKEIVNDLRSKGISISKVSTHKTAVHASINEHLNRINYKGDRSEVISNVVKLLANQ